MVSRRKAKDGEWIIIHNRSLDAAAVAFQYREDFKTEWDVTELDDRGLKAGPAVHVKKLEDWKRWKNRSDFSGTLRYRASVDLAGSNGALALDAGRVGEIAELFVDGRSAGVRLAPPYVWDITTLIRPGRATIEIDVTNTARSRWSDPFSHGETESGLLGPVSLRKATR